MSQLSVKQTEVLNGINRLQNQNDKKRFIEQYNWIVENHAIDKRYDLQLNALLDEMNGPALKAQKEKELRLKERKKDIEEYYHMAYNQQIFLAQLVVFFTVLALLGGGLHRMGLMSETLWMVYLGTIASVAVVVILYYLWDYYTRDATIFPEYDFSRYISVYPASPTENVYTELDLNLLSC